MSMYIDQLSFGNFHYDYLLDFKDDLLAGEIEHAWKHGSKVHSALVLAVESGFTSAAKGREAFRFLGSWSPHETRQANKLCQKQQARNQMSTPDTNLAPN